MLGIGELTVNHLAISRAGCLALHRKGALHMLAFGLGLAIVSSAPTTATAQSAAEPPPEKNRTALLEEVIVTAQKRSETLSDIPMAISAFDQKSMEKLGTSSLANAISLVPNMQNGTGGLTIRGIGTTSVRSTAPTVAIHVDGIYTDLDPRGLGSNYDLARVEVLRGPQGTLYGRNATAGVVNLVTNKPSDEFELFGDISYHTGNERLVRTVLNTPMTDSFGLRLAVRDSKSDGTLENPAPGQADASATDNTFARLSLAWQPMERLTWDMNFDYMRDNGIAGTFQADWYVSKPDTQTAIVYQSGLPDDEVPPYGPQAEMFGEFEDRDSGLAVTRTFRSTLRYDLSDALSLAWLAGHSDFESEANNHSLPIAMVDHSARGNDSLDEIKSTSHELNLNFEGAWGYGVTGLYYFKKDRTDDNVLHIWTPTGSSGPDAPPELATAIDIGNEALSENIDESKAIFTQLTYNLSDTLRLTGGIRYSRDSTELGAARTTFCPFGSIVDPNNPPSATCQLLDTLGLFGGIFGPEEYEKAREDYDDLSWKVVVDHDFTADLLGYATVSTGYKQGAIPGRAGADPIIVEPETNTNYELGLRSQLFDRSMNLNLTLFWMDYVDLQVSSSGIVNGAPAVVFSNVGKARSRGAELEWTWNLTPLDRIDGFLTYLDAEVTEYPNAPDAFRGDAFTFDAAGNKLPNSPEHTFRIAYSHIFDLGGWGELTPTVSTYYSAETWVQVTNGPQDYNPSFWRSDFFLRYNTPEEHFSVEAFVNNIEDERYKATNLALLTEAVDNPDPSNPAATPTPGGGIQYNSYTPGRTMGLRLGFSW